ncbi:hypothetical protein EDD55_103303 [Varunaivibrio sulfuroxidans]|uniref:Uncharacterized protein n=2 Tax=Varunaivibrio sulfuroxidans TaxID=1773489 RepID=A0A4R3JCA3_9PROT|nr:hypothetical protein EDD55_103303 [Varunaivibrio sulfuroxidans]
MVEVSTSKQIEGILNCLNALHGEARDLDAPELARLIGIAALAAEDQLIRHIHKKEVVRALSSQHEGAPHYPVVVHRGDEHRSSETFTALPALQVVDGGRR